MDKLLTFYISTKKSTSDRRMRSVFIDYLKMSLFLKRFHSDGLSI